MIELAKEAHNTAAEKGFHDKKIYNERKAVLLIASEAFEAFECYRANKNIDLQEYYRFLENLDKGNKALGSYDNAKYFFIQKEIKETVECEIADVFIRVLDYSIAYNCYQDDEPLTLDIKDITDFTMYVTKACMYLIDGYMDKRFNVNVLINLCYRISELLNFDLIEVVKIKMWYNKNRKKLHGKNF